MVCFLRNRKDAKKDPEAQQSYFALKKHILNESKIRQKNLPVAWIDYSKAYDIVPQNWIINCLKMYKISHEVKSVIEKTMKSWRVKLTAGET